jgi:hypothetical protein
MTIDNEDINQEYALQKLLGKKRKRWQVKADLMKSAKYANSYANKVQHIRFDDIQENGDYLDHGTRLNFADAISIPSIDLSFIEKQYLNLLINGITFEQRKIVRLLLHGYTHRDVGKILARDRSTITRNIKKIKIIINENRQTID